MAEKKLLFQSFPVPDKDTWVKVAASEIDGNDPFQSLGSQTPDGIGIRPYYDHTDKATLHLDLPPDDAGFLGARAWHNLPRVTVRGEKRSNTIILDHLANGADGVLLDVTACQTLDVATLLNNVELPYCMISFKIRASQHTLLKSFSDYLRKKKISSLNGFLLWDDIPKNISPVVEMFAAYPTFKPLVLHTTSATDVKQLTDLLVQGVNCVDKLTDAGITSQHAINAIGFSVSTSPDFFAAIARLKALRYLWKLVASAYGCEATPFLHAYSDGWLTPAFQPHGNMLKSTTAGLAAICGGCDALTILPENEDDTTMNRIARNVSNILREESHLDKVADPTAGSYYADHLTQQFIHAAWSAFQQAIR